MANVVKHVRLIVGLTVEDPLPRATAALLRRAVSDALKLHLESGVTATVEVIE